MRIILSVFLLLFLSGAAISEEKIREEGSFERHEIITEGDNEDAAVPDEKTPNLIIERLNADRDLAFLPKDSIALKVAATRYLLRWSPRWSFDGAGGTDLTASTVSGDGSLLAIAETTGAKGSPTGSLLLFMETSEWSFVRYLKMDDEKISAMLFLPNSARLLCRFERQTELKKPYRLSIINPRNGKSFSETKLVTGNISDMIVNKYGSMLFVKPEESTEVFVFKTEDLSKEPAKIETGISDSKSSLALAPDNSVLLICGDGQIKVFDMEFKRVKKESLALPDGARNGKIFFTGSGKDFVVLVPGKDAYLYRNNAFKNIMKIPGEDAFVYSRGGKSYMAVTGQKNSSIHIFSLPEMELVTMIECGKIKPYTAGDIMTCGIVGSKETFFILNDLGDLMEMRKPPKSKKWKKNIIFKANK